MRTSIRERNPHYLSNFNLNAGPSINASFETSGNRLSVPNLKIGVSNMSQSGFDPNTTLEESLHQLKSISTDIKKRFNAATNKSRRIPFTRGSRGSRGSLGENSSVRSSRGD